MRDPFETITESDKKKFEDIMKELGFTPENDKLRPGGALDFKGSPSLNFDETALDVSWAKKFKDENIEIFIRVNGKPLKLVSKEGDDTFRCEFFVSKNF